MMRDEDIFLKEIGKILPTLKPKMKAFCASTNQKWDEDVFADTIIKCHNAIKKKGGLNDTTPKGVSDYFFQAFAINIKREAQYSRNSKRDNTSDLFGEYELFQERNITEAEKVESDLYKDFAVLYLLKRAEEQFDPETFYLFNLKFIGQYTYKELQKHVKAKAIRQRVAEVKKWLKENVTRDEVNEAFNQFKIKNEI